MSNEYHFITNWRIKGNVKEINEIIADASDLPRWWPSVYLESQILKKGDEQGVGSEISLYTKGYLPYTLRWQFTVAQVEPLKTIRIEAKGDFVGYGIWTFQADGDYVNIKYDWNIQAEKPLLRNLTFLLRPIFSANHHWAMAMGESSLKLELARRHAASDEERAKLPAPPPPTPNSMLGFLGLLLRRLFGQEPLTQAN